MAVKKTKTSGNGAGANGANGMPATTAQRLGTILKASRDIMRKDKGLSGEIDRIPVLTWIMFLKFLDDMESMRAEEAKLSGKKFKPAIEPPYRWRDWAAKEDGITGDELSQRTFRQALDATRAVPIQRGTCHDRGYGPGTGRRSTEARRDHTRQLPLSQGDYCLWPIALSAALGRG